MSQLYQCPYDIATSCNMEEGCLGCEQFKPVAVGSGIHFIVGNPSITKAIEMAKNKHIDVIIINEPPHDIKRSSELDKEPIKIINRVEIDYCKPERHSHKRKSSREI